MHAKNGHKLLTQTGLAGFVLNLYEEVCSGKTPNMDRLLSEIEQPEVVAFLRDCQSKEPILAGPELEKAFGDALADLSGAPLNRSSASERGDHCTYQSELDRCVLLRNELINAKPIDGVE